MEAGGEEQWTTIDRKTSKKKSKQEEKPVIEEGWEQVSKKEKRTKKESVSNVGQKNDKSRNGDRYGGGRGGRGADGGSNKGTLPRKNSSKPPRGEGGRGRGGGGGKRKQRGKFAAKRRYGVYEFPEFDYEGDETEIVVGTN